MTLKAPIVEVRRARRGRGVPHPLIATAPTDGWAVRVPLGNRHGYPSTLIRRGSFLFHGQLYRFFGGVLSDCSWLFIPGRKPKLGEEIVFWGRQGDQILWLYELAEKIDVLPYELPTWLSEKVPRIFVENGRTHNS